MSRPPAQTQRPPAEPQSPPIENFLATVLNIGYIFCQDSWYLEWIKLIHICSAVYIFVWHYPLESHPLNSDAFCASLRFHELCKTSVRRLEIVVGGTFFQEFTLSGSPSGIFCLLCARMLMHASPPRCSSRKVYKCFSRVLWATASSHDIDFVLKINSEKK